MHKGIWESIKSLFSFGKAEETLRLEIGKADYRLGVYVFLLAAMLSAIISVAITAVSMYFSAFEYNTLAAAAGYEEAVIDWSGLLPWALFQFIFLVPAGLVFSIIYEGLAFKVMRITGGRGRFGQQYYLASIVTFATVMASAIGLLSVVPCMQLIASLGIVVLTLYFIFYVGVKAYEVVHEVDFLHAFVLVLLLAIPRYIILAVAVNMVAPVFGLPDIVPY